MASEERLNLEGLVNEMGGFGRYQVMLLVIVFAAEMPMSWGIMIMVVAGATPSQWWCTNDNVTAPNSTLQSCVINATQCTQFEFSDEIKTIVSEWSLLCDKGWISATITSIQMGGVLVGAVVAGQLSDIWGRKKTIFLMLGVLMVFSAVAGFSVNWLMFAALRFFIGLGVGGFLVTQFSLPMEFLSVKWRTIESAIPSWPIGTSLFALTAWLEPNWRHLSFITAAFTLLFLATWPLVPESLRWLVVNNKMSEAEAVLKRVVKMNKRPLPDLTSLKVLSARDREDMDASHWHTYTILLKDSKLLKTTAVHSYIWFTCGLIFYALSFGVESLAGNLYLNLFLMSMVEVPAALLCTYLNNRLGRRWSVSLLMCVGCAASTVAVVVFYTVSDITVRGRVISGMALTAKLGLGAGWTALQVFSTESFPTVIRNIGFGTCHTEARIGGILAPQLAHLGRTYTVVPYWVIMVLMGTCSGLVFLASETRGEALQDVLKTPARESKEPTGTRKSSQV